MTTGLSDTVAANVRAEMARRNIAQRALADKIGISHASIYRRLRGDVAFDIAELGAIAEVLAIDVRVLLPEPADVPAPAAAS